MTCEHNLDKCPECDLSGTQDEDCTLCSEGWLPPHEPSKACQSGKRPHCTCDICF